MIKSNIINFLKKAIKEDIKIDIFISENEQFGHYSTNVALKLAKIRGENPLKIAEKIALDVKYQILDVFNKVEIATPGFINFWLKPEVFQDELKEILKKKDSYGRSKAKGQMSKIQIEFVSANPTGPLTLANGRGGFFGDVLSNIMEFCGYKVEREYYVNDTGNQIIILGKSMAAAANLIPWEENFYHGDYIKDWTKKNPVAIKKHKNNYLKIGQLAAKNFLASIKKVLIKDSKIRFDRFTSENNHIQKKSFIKKALAIFEKSVVTYKKDGALWFKTTQFGDDKDRVLITKDGFPTYFLADAGHYLETKKRGFRQKINIMGPDHYGYVKRIQAAAEIMGVKNSKIIITQAVRLIRKGQEVKMSKRKGEFIAFGDLVAEVGADAARFFFLTHSPETHMDFDLELAKERSMKNPVYYVQYAAVRCQSIINKVKITPHKLLRNLTGQAIQNSKLNLLNTPEDINLIRQLARFPEIIEETAEKYSPQILVRYSLELAREFHNFYEKERIMGEGADINLTMARLELIKATQIIFKNILNILGINIPKKM